MRAKSLVQILLPITDGSSFSSVFHDLAQELTARFGGVTTYVRAPAEGRWKTASKVEHDEITVIEVMVDNIDRSYWSDLRRKLERDLQQIEIIIRSQPMDLL